MSGWEVFLGIILGLLVNETCDMSPWLARKLVRWAAFLTYADTERAELRAEELTALINERPGKLFKLATPLTFAVVAAANKLRCSRILGYRRRLFFLLIDRISRVPLL